MIAVEKDFYRIGELTAADIALIRFLLVDVEGLHPLTKKNHDDFLRLYAAPIFLKGIAPELDSQIETFCINALEDYHARIESSFLPLLECALKKDIRFYSEDQSCVTLFHFLASQHVRTKGVKVKTIEILREKNGLDVSRIWSLMSHMLAANVGMGAYREREKRRLVLVDNTTDVEFITSDQPLVNLHGGRSEKSPETLSWYYPISPSLALLIPEVDEEPAVTTESLTPMQVRSLNAGIAAASRRQIFARSRSSLEYYDESVETP